MRSGARAASSVGLGLGGAMSDLLETADDGEYERHLKRLGPPDADADQQTTAKRRNLRRAQTQT
eukprot:13167525-Alexandrium_andersonii.AAC.1